MKQIDFTQPGGFPLTQDQLGFLQTSYSEVLANLVGYRNPGTNVAVRLAGMAITSGITTTISAGWFLYNGALIRFPSNGYGSLSLGHAIYVQVTPTATPITFNDGSTPNVIEDVTGTLVSLVSSTADSSSVFQLARLQDFVRETNWTVETFSSYGAGIAVSGTIKYKKNYLDNTLCIVGNLTVPGTITLTGTTGYLDSVFNGTLMFTLPSGYIPNSKAIFNLNLDNSDYSGWAASVNPGGAFSTYGPMILTNFVGTINTDGKIYIKWLNGGDPSVSSWTFNIVISLD